MRIRHIKLYPTRSAIRIGIQIDYRAVFPEQRTIVLADMGSR